MNKEITAHGSVPLSKTGLRSDNDSAFPVLIRAMALTGASRVRCERGVRVRVEDREEVTRVIETITVR